MVYGAKLILIEPAKENEFITDVTRLTDVENSVQLAFTFQKGLY
jgi:hypothetical protein